MKSASFRLAALAGAAAGLFAAPALAAQPIILGPYTVLNTVLYDIDYAVSGARGQGIQADTIVSIGLPSGVKTTGCEAQIDWFDWNGTAAGLSGPGKFSTGAPNLLVPGQTLEYTSSANGNPNNYPNFQENVFRDQRTPFEGYAQVRVQCDSAQGLRALRVDAEFATRNPSSQAGFPPSIKTKTINVSKPAGIVGY